VPALAQLERVASTLFMAISAGIVIATPLLPMADGPSHLATGVIAKGLLLGDPFFAEHYRFLPTPVPYWATTLLLVPALAVSEPTLALRLVMLPAVVGLPLAFRMLARTVAPENLVLTPLVCATAFQWYYFAGSTSFVLGVPLVLVCFAAFLRLSAGCRRSLAVFAVALAALYTTHVYDLAALVATIGVLLPLAIVWPRSTPLRLRREPVAALLLLALAFGIAASFVLAPGERNSGLARPDLSFELWRVRDGMYRVLRTPEIGATGWIYATGMALVLLFGLAVLRHRKAPGRVVAACLVPALFFLVILALGPEVLHDGQGRVLQHQVASRFAIFAVLFGLLAVRLPTSRGWQAAALAVAIASGGIKLAEVWTAHRFHDRQTQQLLDELIARIPTEKRLLPVLAEPSSVPVLRQHRLGDYVVSERHGYSAMVYAVGGEQPLQHVRGGSHRDVFDRDITDDDWRFFDYVLVQSDQNSPEIAGLAEHTEPVARSGSFHLYRVHPVN
jgi:hypothetical protein